MVKANSKERREEVNRLARQYYIEVGMGNGKTPETRSPRQIRLANEIIENIRPFLHYLARKIVYGEGYVFSQGGGNRASLKRHADRFGDYGPTAETRGKPTEREFALDELVNEAVIGILEKLDGYDQSRFDDVFTYLAYNSASAMGRNITEKLGLVRIPVHCYDNVVRLIKEDEKVNRAWRSRTIDCIAERLCGEHPDLSAALIYLSLTGKYVSLDEPAPNYEKNNSPAKEKMESRIENDDAIMSDEEAIKTELKERVRELLRTLTPREEFVIKKRFGIDCEPKTLEEVGEKLGVIRERVRQIEANALRKLRQLSRSPALFGFLDDSELDSLRHVAEKYENEGMLRILERY